MTETLQTVSRDISNFGTAVETPISDLRPLILHPWLKMSIFLTTDTYGRIWTPEMPPLLSNTYWTAISNIRKDLNERNKHQQAGISMTSFRRRGHDHTMTRASSRQATWWTTVSSFLTGNMSISVQGLSNFGNAITKLISNQWPFPSASDYRNNSTIQAKLYSHWQRLFTQNASPHNHTYSTTNTNIRKLQRKKYPSTWRVQHINQTNGHEHELHRTENIIITPWQEHVDFQQDDELGEHAEWEFTRKTWRSEGNAIQNFGTTIKNHIFEVDCTISQIWATEDTLNHFNPRNATLSLPKNTTTKNMTEIGIITSRHDVKHQSDVRGTWARDFWTSTRSRSHHAWSHHDRPWFVYRACRLVCTAFPISAPQLRLLHVSGYRPFILQTYWPTIADIGNTPMNETSISKTGSAGSHHDSSSSKTVNRMNDHDWDHKNESRRHSNFGTAGSFEFTISGMTTAWHELQQDGEQHVQNQYGELVEFCSVAFQISVLQLRSGFPITIQVSIYLSHLSENFTIVANWSHTYKV